MGDVNYTPTPKPVKPEELTETQEEAPPAPAPSEPATEEAAKEA